MLEPQRGMHPFLLAVFAHVFQRSWSFRHCRWAVPRDTQMAVAGRRAAPRASLLHGAVWS